MVGLTGMWQSLSGYAKALASVFRGVYSVKRIKIGFFLCRIQVNDLPPPRCYRCHDIGHYAKACDGPDLGDTCRRCAGKHTTNRCTEGEDRCVACDRRRIPPIAHELGSNKCGARRIADTRGPPAESGSSELQHEDQTN